MFWRQNLVYPFTVLCCELQSEYPVSQSLWTSVFSISALCHYPFSTTHSLCDFLQWISETTWLVSHSTPLLLLHRSLSAPSSCVSIKWGCPLSCFIDWDSINHLICFVLPKSVCVLLKITFVAFFAFSSYFVLLLVCHMFLEPNKHFILTTDCSVCDSFVPPS